LHIVVGFETENICCVAIFNAIRNVTLVEPAGTFLTYFGNTFAFFDTDFASE